MILDSEQAKELIDDLPGQLLEGLAEVAEISGALRLVAFYQGQVVFDRSTRIQDLLVELPEVLARDLEPRTPVFAREMSWRYLVASEEDRADMVAFCESGGPERVRQIRLEHEDGIPTSADLARQFHGEPPRCGFCETDGHKPTAECALKIGLVPREPAPDSDEHCADHDVRGKCGHRTSGRIDRAGLTWCGLCSRWVEKQ